MVKQQPLVLLKGQKNGITIQLDEGAGFNLIRDALRKKVADARGFFAGANTNVIFKGRTLSEDEEKGLLDVIFSETTLDVSFVANADFRPGEYPAPETPDGDSGDEPAEETAAAEPVPVYSGPTKAKDEYVTTFYRHSLRSGQTIHFDGSVVVLGDANAGSEIVAQGNVIVLGALRGMVHAGSGGDSTCFVSALSLTPTQLRISNIITSIQQERARKNKTRQPEYAYIKDGQVYVVRH